MAELPTYAFFVDSFVASNGVLWCPAARTVITRMCSVGRGAHPVCDERHTRNASVLGSNSKSSSAGQCAGGMAARQRQIDHIESYGDLGGGGL